MPLIEMKEICTPLKLVGIKFFRSRDGEIYIKYRNRPRKKVKKTISQTSQMINICTKDRANQMIDLFLFYSVSLCKNEPSARHHPDNWKGEGVPTIIEFNQTFD